MIAYVSPLSFLTPRTEGGSGSRKQACGLWMADRISEYSDTPTNQLMPERELYIAHTSVYCKHRLIM
jgi:hypothetical protein